jgi:CO/xanthine dehydrogenase FAD-binding subunit
MAIATRRPWTLGIRELVDVKGLAEAREVVDSGDYLRVGACVTAARLATSRSIRHAAPALAEAAAISSSPALRNRATLGGNIATPHPAGDIVTALLATDAVAVVIDGNGERELPLAELVRSKPVAGTLTLAVKVRKHRRGRFERLGTRTAFGRSLVSVAASVSNGRLFVALGGMNARPFPATETAAAIERGEDPASAIDRESRPPDDGHATGSERARLARALVCRAAKSLGLG